MKSREQFRGARVCCTRVWRGVVCVCVCVLWADRSSRFIEEWHGMAWHGMAWHGMACNTHTQQGISKKRTKLAREILSRARFSVWFCAVQSALFLRCLARYRTEPSKRLWLGEEKDGGNAAALHPFAVVPANFVLARFARGQRQPFHRRNLSPLS